MACLTVVSERPAGVSSVVGVCLADKQYALMINS